MTPSLPCAPQIGSRQVVEALRRLAAEVGGLKAFEPGVREAIGNTNWTVLMQRLDEADALSRTAQAPVAVKPLEWEAVEGLPCTRERAQALGGEYEIVRLDGDDEPPSVCFRVGSLSFVFILEADPLGLPGDRRPRQFASVDAAKAAAQADYERRVLSALASSPAQVEARSDDLAVERAAKAAYENWIEPVRDLEPSWDSLPDSHRERLMDSQRAALRTQVEAKDAPAAPDLLEALSRLVEVCEKQPRISKAYPEPNSPLGMARAAIAKATGRTLAGGSDA